MDKGRDKVFPDDLLACLIIVREKMLFERLLVHNLVGHVPSHVRIGLWQLMVMGKVIDLGSGFGVSLILCRLVGTLEEDNVSLGSFKMFFFGREPMSLSWLTATARK